MLDMTNNLNQNIERETSLTLANEQNRFFETRIGNIINRGLDIGIRMIFPSFLEDGIIEVKDALFNEGLGSAVRTAIDETINLGRQALNFITRGFRSTPEAMQIMDSGGLTENVAKAVDEVITKACTSNNINEEVGRALLARKSNSFRTN